MCRGYDYAKQELEEEETVLWGSGMKALRRGEEHSRKQEQHVQRSWDGQEQTVFAVWKAGNVSGSQSEREQ